MPNDADSLIEPDVDDPAEDPSDQDTPGDVADPEAAAAADTDAPAESDIDAETSDVGDDATQAVPLVDGVDEDEITVYEDDVNSDGLNDTVVEVDGGSVVLYGINSGDPTFEFSSVAQVNGNAGYAAIIADDTNLPS